MPILAFLLLLLFAVAGCCFLWLVVVSCGWLLFPVAGCFCFIFVIRQYSIFNGVKMCIK